MFVVVIIILCISVCFLVWCMAIGVKFKRENAKTLLKKKNKLKESERSHRVGRGRVR